MRGQTADRVIECVLTATGADHVEACTHLRGQLGVDSLDLVNISNQLEEAFELRDPISDDEADRWETVSDIIATVESRRT